MSLELTPKQQKLVNSKNNLDEAVIGKYRLAGQIVQSGLVLAKELLSAKNIEERSVGEICRLCDLFLQRTVSTAYKNVEEKGIALPVQICKNELVGGVAPEEEDQFQGGYIQPGDIVKVSLGVHVDGYTAQACHTVVIRDADLDADTSTEPQPLQGDHADAVCAAYIANEAVVSLLSLCLTPDVQIAANTAGQITGEMIKQLVDKIATIFRVQVAPGSRVRRVRRFLAGQSETIRENDLKGVEWTEESEEDRQLSKVPGRTAESENNQLSTEFSDDFIVMPGEAWLCDIQMAATAGVASILRHQQFQGYNDDSASVQPTMFTRDYSVTYGLKLNASRQFLTKSAAVTSVYPFKLSHVVDTKSEMNQARLALSEMVQHHVLTPHGVEQMQMTPLDLYVHNKQPTAREVKRASQTVSVAREMSTVVLVDQSESGYPELVRLTGGTKTAPPSYVHSKYQIADDTINELLNYRQHAATKSSIKFIEVQAPKFDMQQATTQPTEMELD